MSLDDKTMRYTTESQQSFNEADATVLQNILRMLQPHRYIEIGSGYSSFMALDTNEYYLNNTMHCTFIDPHPEILTSRLKPGDTECISILPQKLQNVDTSVFMSLEEGDVLFVDSTHVLKTDSDLCHILFRVLPNIAPGVWIHFHDIFWPFEYPKKWIEIGRNWNEVYAIRAFLSNNPSYEIQFFTSYLQTGLPVLFDQALPHCKGNGGSLWIRKIS